MELAARRREKNTDAFLVLAFRMCAQLKFQRQAPRGLFAPSTSVCESTKRRSLIPVVDRWGDARWGYLVVLTLFMACYREIVYLMTV